MDAEKHNITDLTSLVISSLAPKVQNKGTLKGVFQLALLTLEQADELAHTLLAIERLNTTLENNSNDTRGILVYITNDTIDVHGVITRAGQLAMWNGERWVDK